MLYLIKALDRQVEPIVSAPYLSPQNQEPPRSPEAQFYTFDDLSYELAAEGQIHNPLTTTLSLIGAYEGQESKWGRLSAILNSTQKASDNLYQAQVDLIEEKESLLSAAALIAATHTQANPCFAFETRLLYDQSHSNLHSSIPLHCNSERTISLFKFLRFQVTPCEIPP